MSVKEFFAFANIKFTVVEFLRAKTDFNCLHDRHKKPFRAIINRHNNTTAEEVTLNTSYEDYFVSDGFNSIKCIFSDSCK
jgi:elongation factor P--beta-lysine ligase